MEIILPHLQLFCALAKNTESIFKKEVLGAFLLRWGTGGETFSGAEKTQKSGHMQASLRSSSPAAEDIWGT